MKIKHSLIIGLPVIIVISAFFHSLQPYVPDTDSFYHLKHSFLYRTGGIFQGAFPWVQYSVINKFSSDIWYGFHILFIPLTFFNDLATGIKPGGFLVTSISLLLVFWSLLRLKVKWPVFWVLIFALASADLLYRLTMLRPHPISIGLTLLLFSLFEEQSKNRKNFLIFITCALFSWIHLSLSWIAILIFIVINGVRSLQKQQRECNTPPQIPHGGVGATRGGDPTVRGRFYDFKNTLLAMCSGLFLGLILRPNPLGAVKITYVQIAQLFLTKNIPIRLGKELTPFVWVNFVDQLIAISILLTLAVVFLLWILVKKRGWVLPINLKTGVWSSLILWSLFFYLSFSTARRSNELFIGFAVIFISLLFTHYYIRFKELGCSIFSAGAARICIIIFFITVPYMFYRTIYRFNTYTPYTFSPNSFREISLWLEENSRPEEIVFNVQWDRFAQLFFRNTKNYYINGMDPIFQYSFDPSLYWKNHFFASNVAAGFTCGKIGCNQNEIEDTYKVLKHDFKASYIMLEKSRASKLYNYLEEARGFKKVFESIDGVLYKIL